MKLKQTPDDFVVIEDADVAPAADGPFTLYRLRKSGLGTMEAVGRAARLLGVPRRACSYGGLKDAHARTEQWLCVKGGPSTDVGDTQVQVAFAGHAGAPFRRDQVRGNRFAITVRDLAPEQAAGAAVALDRLARDGFPNYFDTQRFGSARATGAFPAKQIITGDPEAGLRLLVAIPSRADHGRARRIHEVFAAHWGDWSAVGDALPHCPEQAVARYLRDHPRDFAGAFERLPDDLRHLVLAGWQSYLWNRIVTAWLARQLGPAGVSIRTAYQRLVRWDGAPPAVAAALEGLTVPLPRHDAEYAGEWRELAADVLGSEGVTVEGMIARKLRRTELRRGLRAVRVMPLDLSTGDPGPDALNPGRLAVTLRFALPRGAYATVLLKCLDLEERRRGGTAVGPRRERS